MTIPDNYESEIRPALARFCGWRDIGCSNGVGEYADRTPSQMTDPLRDPVDAWRLMVALLSGLCKVELYLSRGLYTCDLFAGYRPMVHTRGDTAKLALVLAAWAVVQGMEKGEETK